jgi:hypothetical protein
MVKRALLAALGFSGVLFSLAAQESTSLEQTVTFEQLSLYRPELVATIDSSALLQHLSMPNLISEQFLPVSSQFGWVDIQTAEIFPVVSVRPAKTQKTNTARLAANDGTDAKDSTGEMVSPPLNSYYSGGEIGLFYGHSSGKFGRDDFGSYIVGGVGNDKLHITVGAFYDESSGRFPRWVR